MTKPYIVNFIVQFITLMFAMFIIAVSQNFDVQVKTGTSMEHNRLKMNNQNLSNSSCEKV